MMESRVTNCRKFTPNIFNKSKCSHCFRQRGEHSAVALDSNRVARKVLKCGYLFVAPDRDFSNPVNKTKRWQRRWFILYDDGVLTYSVDEYPETVPQACINMSDIIEVAMAEDVTGHSNAFGITTNDRVTFLKGTCAEESKWWLKVLNDFTKSKIPLVRSVKFPGFQVTTASMQSLQCYKDQPSSSKSPPTRDKILPDDKAHKRLRTRIRCNDFMYSNGLPVIASVTESTITNPISNITIGEDVIDSVMPACSKSCNYGKKKYTKPYETETNDSTIRILHMRPKSLPIINSTQPIIISSIAKRPQVYSPTTLLSSPDNHSTERGDPDGRCNLDDATVKQGSDLQLDRITTTKRGWLMKQDPRTGDWTKHWYSLRGGSLFSYHDRISEEHCILDGVLDISSIINITEIPVAHNFGFELIMWDERHIILAALNSNSRDNWINVIRKAAGLTTENNFHNFDTLSNKFVINDNTSDDVKREIENNFITSQYKQQKEIRQSIEKQSSSVKTSAKTKSQFLSSDEEYRTASEGGRRYSIDWGLPMSSSPPVPFYIKSNSNNRLPKRCCSSPPRSNHGLANSVRYVELPSSRIGENNHSVREIAIEKNLKICLTTAEKELPSYCSESYINTNLIMESPLISADKKLECSKEVIKKLSAEVETYQKQCKDLDDRLNRGIEENDNLYHRLRALEGGNATNLTTMSTKSSQSRIKRMDSLSDLTCLNNVNPYNLDRDILAEEYLELKIRFEKAVTEIRAMKKELKESQSECDKMEIKNTMLRHDIEFRQNDDRKQVQMMAERIQDLTLKLTNSDRQVRLLKQKISKTEKRRSIKGKDSFSFPKELEEKLKELELKMNAFEAAIFSCHSTTSDQTMQTELCTTRTNLDETNTDTVQLLLRLTKLERILDNQYENVMVNKMDILNYTSKDVFNHLIDRIIHLEEVLNHSRDNIEQGLQQLAILKSSASCSISLKIDRCDSFKFTENCLLKAIELLGSKKINKKTEQLINETTTEQSTIKKILQQYENLMKNRLLDLLKERQYLHDRNELTEQKRAELLAKRIAYESVEFGRLRAAIDRVNDPNKCIEQITYAEISETAYLMSQLKTKINKKPTTVKIWDNSDLLANVLARCLLSSNGNIGLIKMSDRKLSPISPKIIDELLRQQNELNLLIKRYKTQTLTILANCLATETLSYISPNDAVQGTIQETWHKAQEIVNTELVHSEIAHIVKRSAERFGNAIAPAVGFTITDDESSTFENFADAVQEALRRELDTVVNELSVCYEESLDRLKRSKWRMQFDQDRKMGEGRQLLIEFADIISHKALIDGRILILRSYQIPIEDTINNEINFNPSQLEKYCNLFEDLSNDFQLKNSIDVQLDGAFNLNFKRSILNFNNISELPDINQIIVKLEEIIMYLQSTLKTNTYKTLLTIDVNDPKTASKRLTKLYKYIEQLIEIIKRQKIDTDLCDQFDKECQLIENNKQHNINLDQLIEKCNEQQLLMTKLENERKQICEEMEKQNIFFQQKIMEMETRITELTKQNKELTVKTDEITDLKMISLKEAELRSKLQKEHNKNQELILELTDERNQIFEKYNLEVDRTNKLEKRIETLIVENSNHIACIKAVSNGGNLTDIKSSLDCCSEFDLQRRYQDEIEQLRTLCEKGLLAMEATHKRVIIDLEESHQKEIQKLLSEKQQVLDEETKATLAALDAMRKAHQNEVQREVTRFKTEFINQMQRDKTNF